jgi:hypothetical protein
MPLLASFDYLLVYPSCEYNGADAVHGASAHSTVEYTAAGAALGWATGADVLVA